MAISLKKNKVWIIIIVVIIIISLNFYQKEIKDFFYSFSSPIQKSLWQKSQRVSNFFEAIVKTKNRKREIEDLKLENQKLLSEIAFVREVKKENETLREALEIGLREEYSLVFAEIISKDFNEDYVLINKGSTAGIFEGQPVITESKALLGKINEVFKNFSRIMLISNEKSLLDAKIQDIEIQGVVEGRGNSVLSLRHIPQDKEVLVGDLIVTTSLGGIFPKGLLVGRVKEVERSDVKPTQEAKITPFFDLTNLENVFIITSLEKE